MPAVLACALRRKEAVPAVSGRSALRVGPIWRVAKARRPRFSSIRTMWMLPTGKGSSAMLLWLRLRDGDAQATQRPGSTQVASKPRRAVLRGAIS